MMIRDPSARPEIPPSEILSSNRVTRLWSEGLRDRGRRARVLAQAERARSTSIRRGFRPGDRGVAPPPARLPEDEVMLPPLGEVRVEELSQVLMERHGFTESHASRAVVDGLMACGYPRDYHEVVAADAFDILDRALGTSSP